MGRIGLVVIRQGREVHVAKQIDPGVRLLQGDELIVIQPRPQGPRGDSAARRTKVIDPRE
ncbi:hypothetical protein I551_4614 [Mycobacterium ulcerans str. Harvey]|uniref:RCK C-terminal domain-containing protein n=1 Tax=Mycobacterium ulcerans str. Harvey TaxID=1299332 RepID=A0ABN0QVU3_MYCUL|nr:hypothetical protein I551_4614 [Mycobacterium ulcerans str. Harvey]